MQACIHLHPMNSTKFFYTQTLIISHDIIIYVYNNITLTYPSLEAVISVLAPWNTTVVISEWDSGIMSMSSSLKLHEF